MLTNFQPPDATNPSVYGLRQAALGQRLTVSPSLAAVISDMALGEPRRDDVAMLMCATEARVADAGEFAR